MSSSADINKPPADRIVWVDCEMTGLDKERDALVEIAVLVTDGDLNILGEGVDVVIRPPAEAVENMGDFVRTMHTTSGLIDEWDDGLSLEEATRQCLDYVREHCPEPGKAPLAGNSVGTDRVFLEKDVPEFAAWLSYRTIDVSSLKELAKRWFPRVYFNTPTKHGGHRALADIRESIQELKYYREVLFVAEPGPTTPQTQAAAQRYELSPEGETDETASGSAGEAELTRRPTQPALPWLTRASHRRWLEDEAEALLIFATASAREDGGFGWLDSHGEDDLSHPSELWITCRMTHCFALGHMLGRPEFGRFADHGITALTGIFRDEQHGGWYAKVSGTEVVDDSKQAYAHAFVVLAAASAMAAGRPGAEALLGEALTVLEQRFVEPDTGLVIDSFSRDFSAAEDYRGLNATMHTVEALLAAADVLGERHWLDRAMTILEAVLTRFAPAFDYLLPEHFDTAWTPIPDYNRDEPAHPFRPYGATLGHSFEWARLALHAREALSTWGDEAPEWLLRSAVKLADRAAGLWGVDGQPGFVYTVDWSSRPVVRERMHWVIAEAIGLAAVLHRVTGETRWARLYQSWWEYASTFLQDPEGGSWFHELDARNEPSRTVWDGKPDVYHALQATLIPRLPVAPTLAAALREDLLEIDLF